MAGDGLRVPRGIIGGLWILRSEGFLIRPLIAAVKRSRRRGNKDERHQVDQDSQSDQSGGYEGE